MGNAELFMKCEENWSQAKQYKESQNTGYFIGEMVKYGETVKYSSSEEHFRGKHDGVQGNLR